MRRAGNRDAHGSLTAQGGAGFRKGVPYLLESGPAARRDRDEGGMHPARRRTGKARGSRTR
jgi:hypothetical protein